ncbi:ABC transporter substrate-binding protein [Arenibaculum pallidiluteum]|uniref:ABC transporter substrate-binding protein n=1 Tax=Arenibaculum pallidiluteum TaxID=2812559 RepID=UPI001A970E92|nr:ABC transporter substrate-binding protein [Arenibaculum pallidiluteum]
MRRLVPFLFALAVAGPVQAAGWDEVTARARGQTVHWNAWAGDPRINEYIAWVAETVGQRFGIALRHVKVADTAEVVSRVLAEKQAGRIEGGSVDLVWINGENFAAMRQNGLLAGPFVDRLPNQALVDWEGKPTTQLDFTIPVDGYESPWGMAQFVFMVDTDATPTPPRSLAALADWVQSHPGRFTYPQPPDFLGSTFLKQVALGTVPDARRLHRPVEDADFESVTAPLWAYMDALHPHLWRGGREFPASGPALKQLLADGEVAMALSFHPGEASRDIASGLLPESVRTFVLEGGTIGNTHFVAIPFNASALDGAMVVADFLLSPEAQARKADPAHWGDMTVLAVDRLPAADRARFDAIRQGPATLSEEELGMPLPEPHPTWMERIEAEWMRRYAAR